MALNTRTLFFSFLSVLVVFAPHQAFPARPFLGGWVKNKHPTAPAPPPSPSLGGWKKIDNLTAPEVVKVGNFSVIEHNKVMNEGLTFASVYKGETQVVSGINYRMVIVATKKDDANAKDYNVFVYWGLNNTNILRYFREA